MVPDKDIALYGYGSVSWKEKMENWKKKQNEKLQVVKHQGESLEDPDFPTYVKLLASSFVSGSICEPVQFLTNVCRI